MNTAAEEAKQRGNDALQQKNFRVAIKHYSRAIELDPTNLTYLSNRSAAHVAYERLHLALDDANATLAQIPDFGRGHQRRGQALLALGYHPREAVEAFEEAVLLEPANAAYQRGLATAKDLFLIPPADPGPMHPWYRLSNRSLMAYRWDPQRIYSAPDHIRHTYFYIMCQQPEFDATSFLQHLPPHVPNMSCCQNICLDYRIFHRDIYQVGCLSLRGWKPYIFKSSPWFIFIKQIFSDWFQIFMLCRRLLLQPEISRHILQLAFRHLKKALRDAAGYLVDKRGVQIRLHSSDPHGRSFAGLGLQKEYEEAAEDDLARRNDTSHNRLLNYREAVKAIQSCCDVLIQFPHDPKKDSQTGHAQVDHRYSDRDFFLLMLGAMNRIDPALKKITQIMCVTEYSFIGGSNSKFLQLCEEVAPVDTIEASNVTNFLQRMKLDKQKTRYGSVFALAFLLIEDVLQHELGPTKQLIRELKAINPNLQVIITYCTLPNVDMLHLLIDNLRPYHISLALTPYGQTLEPNISHYYFSIRYAGEFYEILWKIQKFSMLFCKEEEVFALLRARGLPVVMAHANTRPPDNQHCLVPDSILASFCEDFCNTKHRPVIHCDLSSPANYAQRLKFEGAEMSIIFGTEADIMKVRILQKTFGIKIETIDEQRLLELVASL